MKLCNLQKVSFKYLFIHFPVDSETHWMDGQFIKGLTEKSVSLMHKLTVVNEQTETNGKIQTMKVPSAVI